MDAAKEIITNIRSNERMQESYSVDDWCALLAEAQSMVVNAPSIMEVCNEAIQLIEQDPERISSLIEFREIATMMDSFKFSEGFQKKFKNRFQLYVQQEAFYECRQIDNALEIEDYLSDFKKLARDLGISVRTEEEAIQDHLSETINHEDRNADDHDYDTHRERLLSYQDDERRIDLMFNDLIDR